MELAFILISTQPAEEEDIFKHLQKNSKEFGIIESHSLFGEYDIIIRITADSRKDLEKIRKKVEDLDGITAAHIHIQS